jgi:hypothetical protein
MGRNAASITRLAMPENDDQWPAPRPPLGKAAAFGRDRDSLWIRHVSLVDLPRSSSASVHLKAEAEG